MATQTIPTWTLGDRLTKARHFAGLTNAEMADALGVSRNTITNWESGTIVPKRYAVEAWARITSVDLDWLAGDDAVSVERPHKPRAQRGTKTGSAQRNRTSPWISDSASCKLPLGAAA